MSLKPSRPDLIHMNTTDTIEPASFTLDASPAELAKITAEIDAAESSDADRPGADRLNPSGNDQPAADVEQDDPQSPPSDPTDNPTPENSGTPDAPPHDPAAKQPTDAKTAPQTAVQPDAKAAEKTASKFAREQARKDDSWKALNAEKSILKADRERLARERAEWLRQWEAEAATRPSYTPDQYAQAAEKFEAQGQYDLADAARAEAERLRKNPPADALAAAQARSWAAVKQAFPALVTKGSPENQLALELLERHPALFDRQPNAPEALAIMVQHRLETGGELRQLKASRVPELEGEVHRLKSRIKELEAATSPGPGGGTTQLAARKSPADMSLAEDEADLRTLLAGAR
jgi:hypothetical protein